MSTQVETVFGDVEDLDLVEALPLGSAGWVISTVPATEVNLALLHELRDRGYQGHIVPTAHNVHDAEVLARSSADTVLQPFADAAATIVARVAADRRRDEPTDAPPTRPDPGSPSS
ncbi:MAG: NAD-binding protein [Acidimicrobiia bacterium]|nr:NAD-binding protein [Acidimicrobiia bacterium]